MRILTALLLCASQAAAAPAWDVLIVGEIHDNPAHHAAQARLLEEFEPAAVVFEMLSAEQARRITPDLLADPARLEAVLEWGDSGWPDFAIYRPVFEAARSARIYGAGLSARRAAQGAAAAMQGEAAAYGLDLALPAPEQAAREALQGEAHCGALPEEMLPRMVETQRLRDAMLARAAVRAHAETGGPVAVIAGNGHARRDWGAPSILARFAPQLRVWVVGQTEDGAALKGGFDEVLSAPGVERGDPCAVFRRG